MTTPSKGKRTSYEVASSEWDTGLDGDISWAGKGCGEGGGQEGEDEGDFGEHREQYRGECWEVDAGREGYWARRDKEGKGWAL